MSNEAGSLRAIASIIVGQPDKTWQRIGGKLAVIRILQRAAEKLDQDEPKE